MSIQEKIKAIQDKIEEERNASGGHSKTALEVQRLSAAAVLGGDKEIKEYMELFTTDEDDLARLKPDSALPANTGKNLALAYLMGNGNCGAASGGGPSKGLLFTVGGTFDE